MAWRLSVFIAADFHQASESPNDDSANRVRTIWDRVRLVAVGYIWARLQLVLNLGLLVLHHALFVAGIALSPAGQAQINQPWEVQLCSLGSESMPGRPI